MHKNSGFSMIELLVTVAIVGVLSSLGMASFTEYKRAIHHDIALNQASTLRKALEAGLIEDEELVFFNENRSMQFQPDRTFACNSGCTGITENLNFPGYNHTTDVVCNIVISSGPQSYAISCGHCSYLSADEGSYVGYLVTGGGSPSAVLISVGAEYSTCTGQS